MQELRKAVEKWRATCPGAPPRAMVLEDLPTPYEPRVFLRGNPNNPGEPVPRRFPAVLAGPNAKPFTDGSGRLELANAIASPDNPLTARVFVNRVWAWHFGRGIVATPPDFGTRGEPPTHPELLDHLATAFVRDGRSVKQLHRRILLSATYRQASADRPDGLRTDPENRLLWRMNRQRLDFEALRDSLLSLAGRLDRTAGGPPLRDLIGGNRRTVYAFIDRLTPPGLLRSFDVPSSDATSPQRDATTVPQQALFLMNSPLALDCARRLAHRPDVAAEKDVAKRVDRLYRLVYGRPASPEELALAREFLGDVAPPERWERFAHALLLTNEALFVD